MLRVPRIIATPQFAQAQLSEVLRDGRPPRRNGRRRANDIIDRFPYAEDPDPAVVDFTHAQVWDASTVAVLDGLEQHYAQHGRSVRFEGLDARSNLLRGRLSRRSRKRTRRARRCGKRATSRCIRPGSAAEGEA